jgi:hypothetical protein
MPKLPYNLKYVKGSVHIVASRGYVDYVLHNKIADDIRNWIAGVKVPDEMFFATINHNPSLNVPGSYKGKYQNDMSPECVRACVRVSVCVCVF